MAEKMTPPQALVAYLNSIPDYLTAPIEPIYPQVLEAAGRVRGAVDAAVIVKLLDRAVYYGSAVPNPDVALQFPQDHRLHLDMGTEWYWLSANLEVEGSGGADRIAVLAVINRNRTLSQDVQKTAGWSDVDVQVVDSAATVTVATRTDSFIVRRSSNVQWPAMNGSVTFSGAGDPFFYQCGPDTLKGSVDVLPLAVHIDDGSNLTIDLTMSSDMPVGQAFFLQGSKGFTTGKRPGLYYSWPKLAVEGMVVARGKTYRVQGTGWIDHQLMMQDVSQTAPAPAPPMPGWQQLEAMNGWSWCQFHLSNGDALTVVAFQAGTLKVRPFIPYGYYVRRVGDGWEPIYLIGSMDMDRFVPGLEQILFPSDWTYRLEDVATQGGLVDVELKAVPWYPDGSFHTGNIAVPSETPVDVALVDRAPLNTASGRGQALTGTGYCESVGFEPPARYQQRALAFLQGS